MATGARNCEVLASMRFLVERPASLLLPVSRRLAGIFVSPLARKVAKTRSTRIVLLRQTDLCPLSAFGQKERRSFLHEVRSRTERAKVEKQIWGRSYARE